MGSRCRKESRPCTRSSHALSVTGSMTWEITWALIGPVVAVISFVCSIGNVPLAVVLWKGGIS